MNIIAKISDNILNPIITLLFASAIFYFLFGLLKFIQNQDNEAALEEGKSHMVWGIIGIFLMMSVLGILRIIKNTAGTFTS